MIEYICMTGEWCGYGGLRHWGLIVSEHSAEIATMASHKYGHNLQTNCHHPLTNLSKKKSMIIRNNKGEPIIEIGEWMVAKPTIEGKIQPYGAHWINRADPPAEGEGFLCPADKLVKLLNDFYEKEF